MSVILGHLLYYGNLCSGLQVRKHAPANGCAYVLVTGNLEWKSITDEGCKAPGYRQKSARLMGSSSRSNWDADCKKTPFKPNDFETLSACWLIGPMLQAMQGTQTPHSGCLESQALAACIVVTKFCYLVCMLQYHMHTLRSSPSRASHMLRS